MKKVIPILLMGASFLLAQCGQKSVNVDKKDSLPSARTEVLKTEKDSVKLVSEAGKKTVEALDDEVPQDEEFNQEVNAVMQRLHDIYEAEDPVSVNAEDAVKGPKYVKFSDIKQWRAVGDDHAAGYDANGKLLAMYDLTYQSTLSLEFLGRSILGTIGVGDLNLRELIRLIRKAIEQKKNELHEGGGAFAGPMTSDDYKKVGKVLDKMEKKYGDLKTPLVGEWWKQIPIKKDAKGKAVADVTTYFRLSDIDFESMMSRHKMHKFQKRLNKVQDHISDILNIDASHLLENLALQRNASGAYDLVQVRKTGLAANEQPDKVIDFIRYQSTFGYALLYLLLKTAISQLASAIPQPVVAAVVKYCVHRWFGLYEEQLSFHRFRAFEFIDEAERGDASPFAFLSATDRMKGGVYVLSHESSIFHHIFKPRKEAYFYEAVKTELANVTFNTAWTAKKALTLSPISNIFQQADDAKTTGMDYLMVMGGQPRFAKRPITAVNYQKPYAERVKRNFLKGINDLLAAMKLPYPGVDTLISILYDVFVMDDIRDAQRWDARLVSLLNEFSGRDFTKEIDLLYGQRVNPFEFDADEERAFVERSKAYIGL